MDYVAAHLREHRVQGVEQALGSTHHKGQGARLRTACTAGYRGIGHLHALLGRSGGHFTGGLRVDGAAIHGRHTGTDTGQHTVFTQPHATHMGRCREHGDHQLGAFGRIARRRADMAAKGFQLGQDVFVQVKQVQRMPGLEQVARHRCAHVAQTNKCDVHGVCPQRRLMVVLTPSFTLSSSNQRLVTVLV